jgi:hypothetical protein
MSAYGASAPVTAKTTPASDECHPAVVDEEFTAAYVGESARKISGGG